jgi:protein-S-isoprenylcysteine O-methyltransferase Ste14
MSSFNIIKNIILSLLGFFVICFFAVTLPRWIAASDFEPFPVVIRSLRFIGWIPIILGTSAILWCYWAFIFIGKGTPWPFNPPKELVITGLYRYVRNPMESSYLLVLFGEVLLFESSALILYLAFNFLFLYIRQVVVEEPGLWRRFGNPYEHYCKSVPRWIPQLKAYTREN